MRINWFKDENNLVYINGATQLAELERTLRFPGLEEAANELRKHPTPEGFTIKGHGRTSGRLFVPDLAFGEHIQMGENIFFFMGEMQECYVIYWLDAPGAVAAPAARRRRTFRLSAPVGTRRGTSQRCCGRRTSPAPVRRAWWRGIRRWCGALCR